MAGPSAAVLFRASKVDERAYLQRAKEACGEVTGTDEDFALDARPFVATIGPEYEEQLSEVAESGLAELLGWLPQRVVTLGAMCNAAEDHRSLARLCLALCEQTGGIVAFGGRLPFGPDLSGATPATAVRVENPIGLDGVLFASSYETVSGTYGTAHYGDAKLLRAWLDHPSFRMIK